MKQLFILLLIHLALITDFTAKVTGVTDGDTVTVLSSNNEQIIVRLEGIDCPEKEQAFGQQAKQATADLCFGEMVTIKKTGEDRYGRTLAYVYVGEKCFK